MKISLTKMMKSVDSQFRTSTKGFALSNEIISLLFTIKEEIHAKKGPDISDEEIDSYILNLVFENLFKKLHELNYDKIRDYYWDSKGEKEEEPDKDIFNFSEKRNLVFVLADHLEKYIRKVKIHYTNPPVEVLKDFFSRNQQNFRKDIS